MDITQFTIGLSSLVGAFMIFLAPIIFKKYLGKAEYKIMFIAVQYLYLIQAFLQLIYALRINIYLGLGHSSDVFLYVFAGNFVGSIEKIFALLPSFIIMGKLANPGVEATMIALTYQIIALSQFTLRSLFGVFINHVFVGVSNDNLDNFYLLIIIGAVFKCVPFLYIGYLLPKKADLDELEANRMK